MLVWVGGSGYAPLPLRVCLSTCSLVHQLLQLQGPCCPPRCLALARSLEAPPPLCPLPVFRPAVDQADEGWTFSTGFINEEMTREHLFPGERVGEGLLRY